MKDIMTRKMGLEDIPLIIHYLRDERFDCCEFNDFWSEYELKNWFSQEKDICVGSFCNGTLVEFCLFHFAFAINKVYLENVFVDSDHRCRGIATQIVDKLVELYCKESKGRDLRFVALVEVSNESAISTLEKGGFNIGDRMLWIQKNCMREI